MRRENGGNNFLATLFFLISSTPYKIKNLNKFSNKLKLGNSGYKLMQN